MSTMRCGLQPLLMLEYDEASKHSRHSLTSAECMQVNGWPAAILTWVLTFVIAGLNTYLIIMSIKNNEFGSTTGV